MTQYENGQERIHIYPMWNYENGNIYTLFQLGLISIGEKIITWTVCDQACRCLSMSSYFNKSMIVHKCQYLCCQYAQALMLLSPHAFSAIADCSFYYFFGF